MVSQWPYGEYQHRQRECFPGHRSGAQRMAQGRRAPGEIGNKRLAHPLPQWRALTRRTGIGQEVLRRRQGLRDAQPFDDAVEDGAHPIDFHPIALRQRRCGGGKRVDRAADLRNVLRGVGDDGAAHRRQQRAQAAQQRLDGGSFAAAGVLGQIGQRDQCVENLVGRLQADQALLRPRARGTAGAQSLHHNAARRFDRLAHPAAMVPRVRLPHGVPWGCQQQRAQIGGQQGQPAIGLGHPAPRRPVRVDLPDHHRQQRRPHAAEQKNAARTPACAGAIGRSSAKITTVLSSAPTCCGDCP